MDIRKIIAILKEKHGVSQYEIAREIGCSQANISYLLRGIHGSLNPSKKVIDGLRRVLKKYGLNEKNATY